MFCSKCGSKNNAGATLCAQCGHPLTASASEAPPEGSALKNSPAPQRPKPSMKGTMMGVAPPDMQAEIDKVKAARAAALSSGAQASVPKSPTDPEQSTPAGRPVASKSNPIMKGTMMGVAPPDMQAEIDKVKAARAAVSKTAAHSPVAIAESQKSKPDPQPKPSLAMKGTMMGVAPPDMQAEIDKVKAARAAVSKTAAHSPVAIAESQKSKPDPQPKPSLAMKGTMMGVAPPDMQAEIDKVKAARAAVSKTAAHSPVAIAESQKSKPDPQPKPSLAMKGTMMGVAPPDMQAEIDKVKAARAAVSKTAAHSPVAIAESQKSKPDPQPKPSLAMKGTMMGVAPPDMQAEIDKVKAARAIGAATAPESPAAKGAASSAAMKGTMMGVAPPEFQAEVQKAKEQQLSNSSGQKTEEAPTTDHEREHRSESVPASQVDALGGTQLSSAPLLQQLSQPNVAPSFDQTPRVRLPAEQATTAASTPKAMAAQAPMPIVEGSKARPSSDRRELPSKAGKTNSNSWLIVAALALAFALVVAALLL